MTKEKTLTVLQNLPNHFEIDDLIEKLIFMEKIDKGLEQAKNSNGIKHEDVKSMITKWSK
jgi:hypothetical protein